MNKTKLIANLAGLCSILCIAAILLIQGCKKNDKVNLADELKDISNYYSKNVTSANLNPFSALTPDWNNVYVHEDGQEVIYEIELQNPKKVIESDHQLKSNEAVNFSGNIIRLLVFKNKQDNVISGGCYMSISSNDDITVIDIKYKHPDKFSGKISYYNLNGSFSNGWMYDKGEITKRISLSSREAYMLNNKYPNLVGSAGKISNTKGEKIMLKQAVACYPGVPQFIYGTVCAGDESGEVVCTTKLTAVIYTEICEGSGGENDNGGYTPPGGGGTTYTIDCYGDRNGKAYDSDCGCIGGNTGIQSCADITDKIKNKCLDSVWVKISGNLDSKIANILKNTFGTSDKINFKIVDGNIDGGYSAKTEVVADKVNSDGIHVFDVKVTLNKNTLPSASQEFIATTMVHEIMHAYFDSQKTYYTQQFQQHRNMAENYIDDLKNAVQAIYSNLDDKAAYALILNGFGDIFKNDLTYWNSLVSKYDLDTAQIINIRDDYKSHNSGTKTECSQ